MTSPLSTLRLRGALVAFLILLGVGLSACDQIGQPSAAPDALLEADDADAEPATDVTAETEAEADSGAPGSEAGAPAAPADGQVEAVARVNGEVIAWEDFQKQAFDTQKYHVDQGGIDPNTDDGQQQLLVLRRQVLRDMIDQRLMEQAAEELNISVSDEELDAYVEDIVTEVGGQAAFQRKLAETKTNREDWLEIERASLIGRKMLESLSSDLPTEGEFVHARQIYCAQESDCEAALARLEAGEDFGAVAKEVSEDVSTKDRAGDLDWIARGGLLSPELEEVIFSLEPGERSDVVRTDRGFHIVEALAKDPARAYSEEQRMALREKKLVEWLRERRATSDIEVLLPDLKDLEGDGASN